MQVFFHVIRVSSQGFVRVSGDHGSLVAQVLLKK